ncbi:HNH endonuclease signature motif containing protein [Cryobacterium sp. TMT2-15-1]|uniref:HNH endonuclease signature motif containing protein n=1 Tax=Cryobacterium sp. TMT2-15-1 TaxID=1259246 RepID=UPI003519FA81
MKPSFIEEQEALGEYFEAIAAAERAIAGACARRAELVEAGRRFGQARANAAAVMLAALSLQGPGEERTLTQLTADVFADIILDGVTPSGLGTGIRGAVTVTVTVPVLTLMGLSEEPGFLEGYGPIDPDTARQLAAGAPSFTRILVHPETGAVLSVGRDRYTVPEDLKRFLRVRDKTCRFPGCNRSAAHCDLDHSLDWQFDGLTAHDNLAHLCLACHALKSETGWQVLHHR